MESQTKQTIQVLRMIDYVAMTILESTSESGTAERARDIRNRCSSALKALGHEEDGVTR